MKHSKKYIKKRTNKKKKIKKKQTRKKGGSSKLEYANDKVKQLLNELNIKPQYLIRYEMNDTNVLRICLIDNETQKKHYCCIYKGDIYKESFSVISNTNHPYSRLLYMIVYATIHHIFENINKDDVYFSKKRYERLKYSMHAKYIDDMLTDNMIKENIKSALLFYDLSASDDNYNMIKKRMNTYNKIEYKEYSEQDLKYLRKDDFDMSNENNICGNFNCVYKLKDNSKNKNIKDKVVLREYQCNEKRKSLNFHQQLREQQTDIILYSMFLQNKNNIFNYIPKIYYIHFGNECYYSISEYIKGDTLDNINNIDKKVLFTKLLLYFKYIVDYGIVHHDLKPSNIMFNKDTMEVKVIDFGLSKYIGDIHPGNIMTQNPLYFDLKLLHEKKYKIMNDFYSILIMFIYKLQKNRDENFDTYKDDMQELRSQLENNENIDIDYYKKITNNIMLPKHSNQFEKNLYLILKMYIDNKYNDISFDNVNEENAKHITEKLFSSNKLDLKIENNVLII